MCDSVHLKQSKSWRGKKKKGKADSHLSYLLGTGFMWVLGEEKPGRLFLKVNLNGGYVHTGHVMHV